MSYRVHRAPSAPRPLGQAKFGNQKAFINLGRNLTNGLPSSVKRADCILADNSIENSQQAVNLKG